MLALRNPPRACPGSETPVTPTASLRQLVRTWAGVVPAPVEPPADPAGLWRLLWDHHVEAAFGPLLPPQARNDRTDAVVAEARGRTVQLLLELERLAQTDRNFSLRVLNFPPEINFAFIDNPALSLYIILGCLLSCTFLVPITVCYIVAERGHLS